MSVASDIQDDISVLVANNLQGMSESKLSYLGLEKLKELHNALSDVLEEDQPPPKPELSYARNEVALVLKSIFLLRTRIAKLSADTRVARKPKPALATADIPSKIKTSRLSTKQSPKYDALMQISTDHTDFIDKLALLTEGGGKAQKALKDHVNMAVVALGRVQEDTTAELNKVLKVISNGDADAIVLNRKIYYDDAHPDYARMRNAVRTALNERDEIPLPERKNLDGSLVKFSPEAAATRIADAQTQRIERDEADAQIRSLYPKFGAYALLVRNGEEKEARKVAKEAEDKQQQAMKLAEKHRQATRKECEKNFMADVCDATFERLTKRKRDLGWD